MLAVWSQFQRDAFVNVVHSLHPLRKAYEDSVSLLRKWRDPLTGEVISDLCWDGFHFKRNRDEEGEYIVGCTGWMVEGEAQQHEDTRCYCLCHNDVDKKRRPKKPESMDLFEWRK